MTIEFELISEHGPAPFSPLMYGGSSGIRELSSRVEVATRDDGERFTVRWSTTLLSGGGLDYAAFVHVHDANGETIWKPVLTRRLKAEIHKSEVSALIEGITAERIAEAREAAGDSR